MPNNSDDDLLIARAAIEAAARHCPPGLKARGTEHGLPLGSLLDFLGYGRLDAAVWFLGIEEGVHSGLNEHMEPPALERNLRVRGAPFDPLMGLAAAMELLGHPCGEGAATMVWQRSAQIACGLSKPEAAQTSSGAELLNGRDARRWAGRWLGARAPGSKLDPRGASPAEAIPTFLGEVRPLPMHGLEMAWHLTPYRRLFGFGSRAEYQRSVVPYRVALWRELVSRALPRFVVAHGKSVWPEVDRIFGAEGWSSQDGMRKEAWTKRWGPEGGTRLFKLHSFAMGFHTVDIERLVGEMRGAVAGRSTSADLGFAHCDSAKPRRESLPSAANQPLRQRAIEKETPDMDAELNDAEFQRRTLDFAESELHRYGSRRARGVNRRGNHATVSTGDSISYSVDALQNPRTVRVNAFSGSPTVQQRLEGHLSPRFDAAPSEPGRPRVVVADGGKRYIRFEWPGSPTADARTSIKRCLEWFDRQIRSMRS